MRVCVHGNIGVGKTTLIESQYKDFERMIEPIEQWQSNLEKYNIALKKWFDRSFDKETLTLQDQTDLAIFQIQTTISRVKIYSQLDPKKNYIFERSVQESFETFCQVLKPAFDKELWSVIKDFTQQMIKLEPTFTENIYLKEQTDVIMKRIQKRGRKSEEFIPQQYIEQLQKYYNKFEQKNLYNPSSNENSVYVIGSVGVGKTTFIENIKNTVKKIERENLDNWSPFLQLHLKNVANQERSMQDCYTFWFQLRVLTSRLQFRQENTLYERCILEEIHVFVPQYRHLFSNTQYDLIMEIYNYISEYVISIQNQTIFHIKISIEKELQNIKQRNRFNEIQLYTKEYLEWLRNRYDQLEQTEIYKKVKQNGKLYIINW